MSILLINNHYRPSEPLRFHPSNFVKLHNVEVKSDTSVISVTTATIATIATSMIIEVLASTLADLDWLRIYLDIDYR